MSDLLDTPPLRDQRTMIGIRPGDAPHTTPEDVRAAWQQWADKHGLTLRRRRGDHSTDLRKSRKTIIVYVSGGKWIADCPGCNGGVAAWPYHDQGCCLDCGTIYTLEYPPAEDVDELVELLRARGELDRNYWPHKGETMEALRAEQDQLVAAQPVRGSVDLATLKATLSPEAFADLERAGLV